MNLKSPSSTKLAPGVHQQQQAEALSKQRAAQAAQAQAQAQSAAQSAYAMQINQYQPVTHSQPPPMYSNAYPTHSQGAPPPYPTQQPAYVPPMAMMHQQQQAYATQPTLFQQATQRAGRQRASTMDQQQSGIPPAIQRVASHLDPNAPIRLQPSPAYYPPPPDGYHGSPNSSRRRNSRGGRNRDFISNLEAGAMNQWH